MTAHTPGPWSVYEDANKVAAHGAKHLISLSAYGDYYTESLTDERGEFFNPADARLIAAAPDLLSCLTMGAELDTPDMLDWIADRLVAVHGENPHIDFVVSLRDRANAMRAAIAKAKGESA